LVQVAVESYSIVVFQDLHGVDLEEFKYGGTNITAFRLVDPDGPEVRKVVREWNLSEAKNKKGEISSIIRVQNFT
jgi:ionotropic glutamate receptor